MNDQMNNQKQKPAILWAVDPYQTDSKPDEAGVANLVSWANTNGYDIRPVYVISQTSEGFEFMSASEQAAIIERCKVKTQKYMHAIGVPETKKPKVLTVESQKSRAMAESLVKLANQYQSPWIVVSSHGYHGINHALFGSFAETVLRYAKQPVLFLSQMKSSRPKAHLSSKRILFPTDFSTGSHAAFQEMLKLAKSAHFELQLFYANVWPTLTAGVEVPIVLTPEFMDEQENDARKEAFKWTEEAAAEGVEAKLVCDSYVPSNEVALSILKQAKESGVDFIALTCMSGNLSAFLFGSVSRDVFRKSECPVLVYGPQSTEGLVRRAENEQHATLNY